MLAYIDISSFNDLNIHISFYVTFAGFLRSDEFTWDEWDHAKSLTSHISRQSIKFIIDDVVIHLSKSKIDQFDKEMNLILSYSNDVVYSVRAIYYLFNKHWFFENIQFSFLKIEVLNLSKYSNHFFHREAINMIISTKLSLDDIKILDQWKSDTTKLYLTEKSLNIINFAINK